MFLFPPYSPNLNPVEDLWKWLKTFVVYNVFESVQDIRKNFYTFIIKINQDPKTVIN
ncbi:transposase [Bacillus wiedmannii]|uniref:transposase n=1 Tax=Bacillus wiedmannii TaxID=1890302 RepID=UPI0039FD0853